MVSPSVDSDVEALRARRRDRDVHGRGLAQIGTVIGRAVRVSCSLQIQIAISARSNAHVHVCRHIERERGRSGNSEEIPLPRVHIPERRFSNVQIRILELADIPMIPKSKKKKLTFAQKTTTQPPHRKKSLFLTRRRTDISRQRNCRAS